MKLSTGVRSIFSTLILLSLVLGMQACGGGGGTPNSAPTASSVSIVDDNGGTFVEGDSLTGNYTYADTNGDVEGTSTFRWLRAGVAISGATSISYTLVTADVSQPISFEVTPIAATGTTTGSLVVSPAIILVNTSLASGARGFYDGSATINGGAQVDVTISLPDTKAIFDEKGFVIAFKGQDDGANPIVLLYKGTFTEVSATAFKASVRVYVNGIYTTTSTISNGVIDAGVTLTGVIVGTGDYANSTGDVSLLYTADNRLTPPVYAFGTGNRWNDSTSGDVFFNIATNFDAVFAADVVPPRLRNCDAIGIDTIDVINEQTGRIRSFTTPALSGCLSAGDDGQILTGYLTNYNSGVADDRLFIVASNDNYSYVGILPCLSGTCF